MSNVEEHIENEGESDGEYNEQDDLFVDDEAGC